MNLEWINKESKENVVVWVHGFLSSGTTCWQSEKSYWPKIVSDDFKSHEFSNIVFTYQTDVFSSNYSLGDVVDSLKELIGLKGILKYKNIIFVCHSMGGIIARKYLLERAVDLINNNNKIGLFLIASPSLGSNYADFFNPIAKLFKHSQAESLRFVDNNPWLAELSKNFRNLKEEKNLQISGKELVEDKFIVFHKLFFFKQIVPPLSGAQYFGNPIKIPKSDHFTIAKPNSKEDFQNQLLIKFLQDFLSESKKEINANPSNDNSGDTFTNIENSTITNRSNNKR